MKIFEEKANVVIYIIPKGNSVSSAERVTGIHHGTILKLLVLVDEKCERIMADNLLFFSVLPWIYRGFKTGTHN